MKIYLAGPMSGYPEHNVPRFLEAAKHLRSLGHEVVCPPEVASQDDHLYPELLRRDLMAMLSAQCEAIALLTGWTASTGATMEFEVARKMLYKVFFLTDDNVLVEMSRPGV